MLPFFNNLLTAIWRPLLALICLSIWLPATAGAAFASTEDLWQGNTTDLFAQASTGALAPASPTNLAAVVVSPTQINLSWRYTNSPNAPATGFQIFRLHSGVGVHTQYIPVGQTAANVLTFLDTGLAPASQYSYYVYAVRVMGANIKRSDFYIATIASTPGSTYCYRSDDARSKSPVNLRAVAIATGVDSATVTLTWTNTGARDLIMIYRSGYTPTWSGNSPLFGNTSVYNFRISLPGNATTFTDSDYNGAGLKRNSYYTYDVFSYTMDGCFSRPPAQVPVTIR